MKINFAQPFVTFDGKKLEGTISERLGQALFNVSTLENRSLSADEKYMSYKLCQKMASNKEIEISAEEASFIKRISAEVLTAGAYGQVVDLIEK